MFNFLMLFINVLGMTIGAVTGKVALTIMFGVLTMMVFIMIMDNRR